MHWLSEDLQERLNNKEYISYTFFNFTYIIYANLTILKSL